MAVLSFMDKMESDSGKIEQLLASEGIVYRNWGKIEKVFLSKETDLASFYKEKTKLLMKERDYFSQDTIEINPKTQGLEKILKTFMQEHHHSADEVRFILNGEGVFEILSKEGNVWLKIVCSQGDLIIIPASRRHLFYLGEDRQIACMRLFKDDQGWEALEPKERSVVPSKN